MNNMLYRGETPPGAKEPNADFQHCGFLRYTCEKQPRITYMNRKMMDILGFSAARAGEADYCELYKSNLMMMIPLEEQQRFFRYLERVYRADEPFAGEMTLLRCDGSRAHVLGWVTKVTDEKGREEFQSVCMDITERNQARREAEKKRYLKALTDVYDKIFELNLSANTIKCIHCEDLSSFRPMKDIAMQMDDALDNWLFRTIAPQDRERVRLFFEQFVKTPSLREDSRPPHIVYRGYAYDGVLRNYSGIVIYIDGNTGLYCCHRTRGGEEALLRDENSRLRDNMKELVTHFSDGLAAFEISASGGIKPLFADENVCEFFGYSQEEWLSLAERYTPLESFMAYSTTSYGEVLELLRNGEAVFTYFDHESGSMKSIRAICSQRDAGARTSCYVMLYAMDERPESPGGRLPEKRSVRVRTFGYFDVFVGERPVVFRNKKSKELLALLIDRRGGCISSEEAIGFLWEDEPVTGVTLARYRKVALRLKNTLEEYGIADIVEAVDGKRSIVTDRLQCDLYDYLSGKEEHAQLFKGSYLTNYSWAEVTLGELLRG